MQMTNLIFLSFILDEEEEVISNVSPQARRLRNCHYYLLHGIISLSSLNAFVEFPFIFLLLLLNYLCKLAQGTCSGPCKMARRTHFQTLNIIRFSPLHLCVRSFGKKLINANIGLQRHFGFGKSSALRGLLICRTLLSSDMTLGYCD